MLLYRSFIACAFLLINQSLAVDLGHLQNANSEPPKTGEREKAKTPKLESSIISKKSDRLCISVYSSGIALVKDVRKIRLNKGMNIVDIRNISPNLELNSVNAKCRLYNPDIKILRYEFIQESLSTSNILKSMVGKNVSFVDFANNKCSGVLKKIFHDADIKKNFALVQNENKIEIVPVERCFSIQSTDIKTKKNALRVYIYSKEDVNEEVELYYITTGITWKPEYTIEVQDELNSARILINGDLKNNTEWDIDEANISFDYSSPTINAPYHQQDYSPAFYRYPEKLSLKKFSSAVVTINSTTDIELNHCYLIKVPELKYGSNELSVYNLITLNDDSINRYIKGENNAFVYLTNGEGKSFLGQQGTKFLNGLNNNDLSFSVGLSQDINASIKYIDIRNVTEKISEISVLIKVKNNTDSKASVYISSELSEDYKILKENENRVNSKLLLWNLVIDPNAVKELYYKVRITKK